MAVKFTNNATSTLDAGIDDDDTTLSVQAGDAAKFPTLGGGDWFPVTVIDPNTGTFEIMKCTARSGATLTVERAQEGTAAAAFSAGARITHRLTAAALLALMVGAINSDDLIEGVTQLLLTVAERAKLGHISVTGAINLDNVYTDSEVDALVAAALSSARRAATVRAATTGNITISTALNNGDTLDGVSLVTGDYVLVKDQSTASQNGVYVVGASPARAPEFDTYNEHPGSVVSVQEGTANADRLYVCTSNVGGTLGSTAIAYVTMTYNGELLSANNLSDLTNAATARTNLGFSANGSSLVTAANYAAMLVLLGLSTVAKLDVEDQVITGGAGITAKDLGNLSGQSITPDPRDRPTQKITNNGSGSILPGSNYGSYRLLIVNASGAAIPTTTGWTLKGDSFDTTSTSKFLCGCDVYADMVVMSVLKVA